MEIVLKINKFCIQTEARKEYEKLIRLYFKDSSDVSLLEEAIEGLKFFLEKADFKSIRSTYPELSGGSNITVVFEKSIYKNEITIKWNQKKILIS
ncbi:MAG: hypothetical protein HQK79_17650 [Desulfobacterales bacterium]|nr:hypothetical protein [Desulfobacterales bacterium]MBF0397519.1 hypothetical protein [Desulfobacterales bacterium]